MQIEPLFKGLTRPPLVFGVPISPFVFVNGSIILITFWTQQFYLILALPITYFVMKIMTKKDEFIFRLLFLKIRFFSYPASAKYRKAKTYVAMKNRNQQIYLPKISI
ncbi:type IV secretion system protein VirB3, partial [Campylobacter fetus]